MLISQLHKKKILILGIGNEGLDNLVFIKKNISYRKLGVADMLTFDALPIRAKRNLNKDINFHFGERYLKSLSDYDVIVKSPGVPFSIINKTNQKKITSQSEIFLNNCRTKVIGVTGTKGKSTVSSLLHETILMSGKNSELVGNIGSPALSFLLDDKKRDFFVYELSSFQLQTISKGPFVAVLLNIFKDHLDKHKNFNEYIRAKEKITTKQTNKDYFIYNKGDKIALKIAKKTVAEKIPFSFTSSESAVREIVRVLNIEEKYLKKVLEKFKGLPHRQEYFGNFKGVEFYNDSASTIPEATIKAIDEIKNTQTIIIGGLDKGGDFSNFIKALKESQIQNIIIFKGTRKDIVMKLQKSKKVIFFASNMREAVKQSINNTDKGKACVLSPGFASFNMFRNYKERGDLFKKYVEELK